MAKKNSPTGSPRSSPVSVIVPTRDEESNLGRCLESVRGWAGEIIVVDSGSTDRTLDIATDYEAKVHTHEYENAPKQWEWILENVERAYPWVLALDADYQVSPQLEQMIHSAVSDAPKGINGYYVRHKQIFRGKWIRHGGIYPRYRLCLFRAEAVFVDAHDLVDNRFYVEGSARRLEADVIEDNHKERDFSIWMQKQIGYARRAAEEELNRSAGDLRPAVRTILRGRNERVTWLKRRWSRLPLYWRSVGYFLYRYVLRLGFLDGKEGFLYHFSQALAFRVMWDARREELDE